MSDERVRRAVHEAKKAGLLRELAAQLLAELPEEDLRELAERHDLYRLPLVLWAGESAVTTVDGDAQVLLHGLDGSGRAFRATFLEERLDHFSSFTRARGQPDASVTISRTLTIERRPTADEPPETPDGLRALAAGGPDGRRRSLGTSAVQFGV